MLCCLYCVRMKSKSWTGSEIISEQKVNAMVVKERKASVTLNFLNNCLFLPRVCKKRSQLTALSDPRWRTKLLWRTWMDRLRITVAGMSLFVIYPRFDSSIAIWLAKSCCSLQKEATQSCSKHYSQKCQTTERQNERKDSTDRKCRTMETWQPNSTRQQGPK